MSKLTQFLTASRGSVPIGGSIFAGFTSPDYTDSFGAKWLRTGFTAPYSSPAVTALESYGAFAYYYGVTGSAPAGITSKEYRDFADNGSGIIVCSIGRIVDNSLSPLYYSTDSGASFTASNASMSFTRKWQRIIYAAGKFWAVSGDLYNDAYGTKVATSTNGADWTDVSLSTYGEFGGIAYSGSVFVAVRGGQNTQAQCDYSTDGITWVAQSMVSSQRWRSVAYGNGKFVAVSGSPSYQSTAAAYSTDGITWTGSTLTSSYWHDIRFLNGYFIATGTNYVSVSTDGITWYSHLMSSMAQVVRSAYFDGKWFAFGQYGYCAYSSSPTTAWTVIKLLSETNSAHNGSALITGSGLHVTCAAAPITLSAGLSPAVMAFGSSATQGGQYLFIRYE